jgi:hypothetical protein
VSFAPSLQPHPTFPTRRTDGIHVLQATEGIDFGPKPSQRTARVRYQQESVPEASQLASLSSQQEEIHHESRKKYNNNNNNEDECDIPDRDEDFRILVEEMAESIDLTREMARMDSFNNYIIVSCLTATASYSTIKSVELTEFSLDMKILYYSAIFLSAMASLSGIHATVIFSLCGAVSEQICDYVSCSAYVYINRCCFLWFISRSCCDSILVRKNITRNEKG